MPLREPAAAFVVSDQSVLCRQFAPPMRPDRAGPVIVQVGQPVGGLDQWRPRPAGRVGEPHAVGGAAEPQPLCGQARMSGRGGRPRGGRRGHTHRAVQGLHAQGEALRAEPDTQLVLEDPFDLTDLLQRTGPIAAGQHRAGDAEMRLFVRSVEPHQLRPAAGPPQQLPVDRLQAPPGLRRPGRVQVVRQQPDAEHRERRPGPTGIRKPVLGRRELGRRRLDHHRVDLDVGLREQRDELVAQHHAPGNSRAPAGVVRRLVQPVRRVVGGDAGPQRVHHLLAMQPSPGGQRQKLHQRGSTALGERGAGQPPAVDHHRELVQQVDPHVHVLTVSAVNRRVCHRPDAAAAGPAPVPDRIEGHPHPAVRPVRKRVDRFVEPVVANGPSVSFRGDWRSRSRFTCRRCSSGSLHRASGNPTTRRPARDFVSSKPARRRRPAFIRARSRCARERPITYAWVSYATVGLEDRWRQPPTTSG